VAKHSPDPREASNGLAGTSGQQLRRRGLLAVVAGLAAGTMVKISERTALAGSDGDVVLGASNTSATPTTITLAANGGPAFQGIAGGNGAGTGVVGISTVGVGVQGQSQSNYSVYGTSVIPGVGAGSGTGVRGDSGTGIGVVGLTGNGVNSSASAVAGFAQGANNSGFAGEFRATNGAGLLAISTAQPGINAQSINNSAVFAASNGGNGVQASGVNGLVGTSGGAGDGVFGQHTANGNGVHGIANNIGSGGSFFSAHGNGVFAQTGDSGVFAAVVRSNNASTDPGLQVLGSFVATGTKSAIVQTSDGWRKLYAQESPENWFEDFGEGQLVNGRASIALERFFRETVDTSSVHYHVFVTPHTSAVEALAVTVRAPDHFEVEANGKGVVEGTFSYRVVAKRKGFVNDRLAAALPPTNTTSDARPPALDIAVNPVPPTPVLPPVPVIK
jgi:hypothetical protein